MSGEELLRAVSRASGNKRGAFAMGTEASERVSFRLRDVRPQILGSVPLICILTAVFRRGHCERARHLPCTPCLGSWTLCPLLAGAVGDIGRFYTLVSASFGMLTSPLLKEFCLISLTQIDRIPNNPLIYEIFTTKNWKKRRLTMDLSHRGTDNPRHTKA